MMVKEQHDNVEARNIVERKDEVIQHRKRIIVKEKDANHNRMVVQKEIT